MSRAGTQRTGSDPRPPRTTPRSNRRRQCHPERLAAAAVGDLEPRSGMVHEDLVAGSVILAHHDIDLAAPLPVQVAEPAVLVSARVVLETLRQPEGAQRHPPDALPLPRQLPVDPGPVRLRTGIRRRRPGWDERRLEHGVIQLPGRRPRDTGRLCLTRVSAQRVERDARRSGDNGGQGSSGKGKPSSAPR